MRRKFLIVAALACVAILSFTIPAMGQFTPLYPRNLVSYYTTTQPCETDPRGGCQQPVSLSERLPVDSSGSTVTADQGDGNDDPTEPFSVRQSDGANWQTYYTSGTVAGTEVFSASFSEAYQHPTDVTETVRLRPSASQVAGAWGMPSFTTWTGTDYSSPDHVTTGGATSEHESASVSLAFEDAVDATTSHRLKARTGAPAVAEPTIAIRGITYVLNADGDALVPVQHDVTNRIAVTAHPTGTQTVDGTVAATQSGNWSSRTQDGAGTPIDSIIVDSGAAAVGSITCAAAADIADSGDYASLIQMDATAVVFEFDKDGSGCLVGDVCVDIQAAGTNIEVAIELEAAITTHAYWIVSRLDEVITVEQPAEGVAGNTTITTNNTDTTVSGFSGGVDIENALHVHDAISTTILSSIETDTGNISTNTGNTTAAVLDLGCIPDLSANEVCLATCLADGSVTINLAAGRYEMSVHGETTWVKEGVNTLAAGGNRFVPGTQRVYEADATVDWACRSATGTGSVCFLVCL